MRGFGGLYALQVLVGKFDGKKNEEADPECG